MMEVLQLHSRIIFAALAVIWAAGAAAIDIRSRRIPNWLTASAFTFGLLIHLLLEGPHSMFTAALAALIAGSIFLAFFIAGGMGAGDVKLIAAVAAIAGISQTSYLLIFTALAGGVMAVVLALLRKQLKQTFSNLAVIISHHRQSGLVPHPDLNVESASTLRLPYGAAIATGCLVTLCLAGLQG